MSKSSSNESMSQSDGTVVIEDESQISINLNAPTESENALMGDDSPETLKQALLSQRKELRMAEVDHRRERDEMQKQIERLESLYKDAKHESDRHTEQMKALRDSFARPAMAQVTENKHVKRTLEGTKITVPLESPRDGNENQQDVNEKAFRDEINRREQADRERWVRHHDEAAHPNIQHAQSRTFMSTINPSRDVSPERGDNIGRGETAGTSEVSSDEIMATIDRRYATLQRELMNQLAEERKDLLKTVSSNRVNVKEKHAPQNEDVNEKMGEYARDSWRY